MKIGRNKRGYEKNPHTEILYIKGIREKFIPHTMTDHLTDNQIVGGFTWIFLSILFAAVVYF